MQEGIHPVYHEKSEMRCACGSVFIVGSTQKELSIEICSQCHPFYTGKKKVVDTLGRVDRFRRMTEKTEQKRAEKERRKEGKKKLHESKRKKAAKKTLSPEHK